MNEDKKTFIAFDQYQRYATISRLIEYHRQKNKTLKFKVLELGSNTYKNLSLFLTQDDILFSDTQLDERMQRDPEFMQVDGTMIQFADSSFDFVVAADVLEHVPADKRYIFISEAYRVAKIGVIICFPINKSYVREAETRINEYYKAIAGEDYIWLKEHLDNGLPDVQDIEKFLSLKNFKHFSFSHGSINLWEKLWYCYFNAYFTPESLSYKLLIDNYYNKKLYQMDVGEECYRSFYVLAHCDCDSWREYSKEMWRQPEVKDIKFLEELLEAQRSIHELYFRADEHEKVRQRLKDYNEAYLTEGALRKLAEERVLELHEAYLTETKRREAAEQRIGELNEAYLTEVKGREAAEARARELNEAYLTEAKGREAAEARARELNEAYMVEAWRRETSEKRVLELAEAYKMETKRREEIEQDRMQGFYKKLIKKRFTKK